MNDNDIDGLVQNCNISSALAMEIVQFRLNHEYVCMHLNLHWLLHFVVVWGTDWFYPYPSTLLHWHTIAPVQVKPSWGPFY